MHGPPRPVGACDVPAHRRRSRSRVFPVILERLAEGTITLAAIGMLIRHLTPENHVAALRRIPT